MLEKSVELSLSDVKTFVTNMFIKLFTFLGKNKSDKETVIRFEKIDMFNNKRFGIVKEKIDTGWQQSPSLLL